MHILLFAGCAFMGGIVSALLGFLGTNPPEPFISRKFLASVLKAFVSGIATAIGSSFLIAPAGLTAWIIMGFTAFLAGVGVDAGLKRLVESAAPKTPAPTIRTQ